MMKLTVFLLIGFVFNSCFGQKTLVNQVDGLAIDSIYMKRIEIINSLYQNKKGDFDLSEKKYNKPKLSKYFFQFRGLSVIIWNAEFVDGLIGHCADFEKEKIYSYEEVFTEEEIIELKSQIRFFSKYRIIDENLVHNSIDIIDDKNNTVAAITFPLIINNKAVVYQTNKKNQDTLLILIKKNGEWSVLCRKILYSAIVEPVIPIEKRKN